MPVPQNARAASPSARVRTRIRAPGTTEWPHTSCAARCGARIGLPASKLLREAGSVLTLTETELALKSRRVAHRIRGDEVTRPATP